MERPPEREERNQLVTRDGDQGRETPHVHPAVDILDRGGELIVRADMPGVLPEAIDARFQNGVLTLSGKVTESPLRRDEDLLREFVRADYYREFSVGDGIDAERITAEYEAGVLTLRLPKADAPQPRKIDVTRK